MERLITIQQRLNAPKTQRNSFWGYNYRSCEGILEAVKPLLKETNTSLTISDEMVEIGGRVYVKATASLLGQTAQPIATVTAYAREEESKKGMDAAQLTGATSSYARKYALNGLFAIDDCKDPDTDEYTKQQNKPADTHKPAKSVIIPKKEEQAAEQAKKRELTETERLEFEQACIDMDNAESREQVNKTYQMYKDALFAERLLQHAHTVCTLHGWLKEDNNNK